MTTPAYLVVGTVGGIVGYAFSEGFRYLNGITKRHNYVQRKAPKAHMKDEYYHGDFYEAPELNDYETALKNAETQHKELISAAAERNYKINVDKQATKPYITLPVSDKDDD